MKGFNRWYDKLEEPDRFYVFVLLCVPPIILGWAGDHFSVPWLTLVMLTWFLILSIVRVFGD